MTRHESVTPSGWTSPAARLLPLLLALVLLAGTAAGAPAPSDTPAPEAAALAEPTPEESGLAEEGVYALGGRSRFEMSFGLSDIYVSEHEWTDAVDVTGGAFSLVFLHWMNEHFAFEVSLGAHNVGVSSRRTVGGDIVDAEGLGSFMAGGRFYLPLDGPFRPHAGLAVGMVKELHVHDRPWQTDVTLRRTTVGVGAEVGVDLLFGRHFVVGIQGGYLAGDGFSPHRRVGINLGWAFGGAR